MLPHHRSVGPRRLYLPLIAWFVFSVVPGMSSAHAGAFDCQHHHCGLLADGPYQNYVIGTLTRVATRADVKQVYQWAKRHGYWQSLPETLPPYLNDITMVTITPSRAPQARPVTVFMQRSEYTAAPLTVGDLVRYTPHTSDAEAPKGDPVGMAFFQGLTGCVATLCSRNDSVCLKRYRPGLFTKKEGRPVGIETGKIINGVAGINPVSLLPEKAPIEAPKQ